jgi:hypothetical protein
MTVQPMIPAESDPNHDRGQVGFTSYPRVCSKKRNKLNWLESRFPVLRKALPAIDGSSLGGLKRNFALFTTVRTDCLGHFSGATERSRASETSLSFHWYYSCRYEPAFTSWRAMHINDIIHQTLLSGNYFAALKAGVIEIAISNDLLIKKALHFGQNFL